MQCGVQPCLLVCSGLHRSPGLHVFHTGLSGSQVTRELQRGQVHHLQHADLLCCLVGLHPGLHQLSWKVFRCCGDLCYSGLQFWFAVLLVCAKVFHNFIAAGKEYQATPDGEEVTCNLLTVVEFKKVGIFRIIKGDFSVQHYRLQWL